MSAVEQPNPYEWSPEAADGIPTGPGIEPTGTFLVITTAASLPPRCVFTNAPTNPEDRTTEALKWSGHSFRLSSGEVHECHLDYSVSPEIRTQQWVVKAYQSTMGLGITLVTVLLLIGAEMVGLTLGVGLAIVPAVLKLKGYPLEAPRLFIADFKDGRFWIKGCDTRFLLTLRTDLDL